VDSVAHQFLKPFLLSAAESLNFLLNPLRKPLDDPEFDWKPISMVPDPWSPERSSPKERQLRSQLCESPKEQDFSRFHFCCWQVSAIGPTKLPVFPGCGGLSFC
jgi:hypothetical protein